jgi:hypothetical protein
LEALSELSPVIVPEAGAATGHVTAEAAIGTTAATAQTSTTGAGAVAVVAAKQKRNGSKLQRQQLLPEPSKLSVAAKNPVPGLAKKANALQLLPWVPLVSTVL